MTLAADPRCPLCRERLEGPADQLAVCGGCDAVHHRECVEEFGGGACATLGCGRRLSLRDVVIPRAEELLDEGRTLVLLPHDAGCLRGGAVFGAMALGAPAYVGVFAYGVAERRWPMWTLLLAALLPLVVFAALEVLRWRRRDPDRPGRRRRPIRRRAKGE